MKMKKILCSILALALVLSTMGTVVFADEEQTLSENIIKTEEGQSALEITTDTTIVISGDITLQGAKGGAGIYVAKDVTLTVKGTGTLTAIGNNGEDNNGSGAAGIGGTAANGDCGNIVIDGVTVVAKGYGRHGAGIGSGNNGISGKITIQNGANVIAQGGYYVKGGPITSKWGKNEAEGGAGIGGGSSRSDAVIGDIKIDNSKVVAFGGQKAAGIGCGYHSGCGKIEIVNDSDVTATGGASSAGIGTSRTHDKGEIAHEKTDSAEIIIENSVVYAAGGEAAAAIGTGYNCNKPENIAETQITISGSKVEALGGKGGAGIGGGITGNHLDINIESSNIVATAGEPANYDWFTEYFPEESKITGHAIGCGANEGKAEYTGSEIFVKEDSEIIAYTTYAEYSVEQKATDDSTLNAIQGVINVKNMPKGTITPGFTRQDGVWGEAKANSEESFYVELYAGDEKIATTTLNNIDGIIDGDVYVTWSIPFAGSTDDYWTVVWEEGHPTAKVQPTKVVLYSDGVKVAENDVQMNAPDNLNPVVWTELEYFNLKGEGTEGNPYLINNLRELKLFRDKVNSGETYHKKTVKLAADIDLNNEEWTPIGNSTNNFQGTFDGGEHTISNILITGYNSNAGLFGFTTNGEIKNLTVENAMVSGRLNVGVVAGTPYTSKYTNIKVTGHVEVNGMSYVGGVGGKNAYANWTNITVDVDETSYVKANSVENGTAYRTYVGGVIGFMGEGGHAVFNVTSNIDVYGSTCDIGGIAGIAHYGNTFRNVTCTADVYMENVDPDGDNEIGGITGVWHDGGSDVAFENCVFKGTTFIAGTSFDTSISGPAYNKNTGSGDRTVTGTVTLNGVEKESLHQAILEAKGMTEPAVIDLLGNNATINKAYALGNDITFQNGMILFDGFDGSDPNTYDPAGIHDAVMTISNANVTFDNVILSGNNVKATSGIFVLATGGVMTLKNGSKLNVTGPTATAVIYSEQSCNSQLVVMDSQINIDGKGNGVRGILATELDADNAEISIKNITDNALRNVKGTVDNSEITIDGAEYGIKNEMDGTLAVTDSTVVVKNVTNEKGNAGIYLDKREKLAETNSVIDAKIYVAETNATQNTLTFQTNGGEKIASVIVDENDVVSLSQYQPEKEGYDFAGWYTDETLTQKVTEITLDTNKTIYAKWEEESSAPSVGGLPGGGGSGIVQYTVTFQANGGSEVEPAKVKKGEAVDVPEAPVKEGFVFAGWYTDAELTNKYDFAAVVEKNLTLYAGWTEAGEEPGASDDKTGFTDLDAEAWYYEVVKTAIAEGLMNGVSETEFAPNTNLTRGMFVTILYRADGEVSVEGESAFSDVAEGQYYTDAVIWAAENGIVTGMTEDTFAPDENVTREQMATMIGRYLTYKNIDVADGGEVAYTDEAEIAEWAADAVKLTRWAGLLEGNADGSFAPKRNTTRAEAAALFVRLLNVLQ